jgi:hypothetical protein
VIQFAAMRHVLAFLGALLLFVLLLNIASPAKGQALVHRIVHFVDPIPPVSSGEPAAASGSPALAPVAELPPWRVLERAGDRAYGEGDFAAAARAFADASPSAPTADSMRLRKRANDANLYRLMAADSEIAAAAKTAPVEGVDPREYEKEYRRRLDSIKPPTAGAYLALADWAASRGLRSHLAFLYERVDSLRATTPSDDMQRKVTRILKEKRKENVELPREVLEAIIHELPASEAADLAREETGIGGTSGRSGVGGTAQRGQAPGSRPEDAGKAADAYRLMKLGATEYQLAVPGSKDVNKHRRAALDAYTKARLLFEEIDKASGYEGHQREIGDCYRNIAELRKDLPIGK